MTNRPAASMPAPFHILIAAFAVLTATLFVGPAEAATPPYDAVVVEANTPIRSGAGRAYYEVGTLGVGAAVTVEAELFGWYKIACPEGVFCFVERKDVNVRGNGTLGVIEADGTPINAAHATKGPADSYRNLMKLDAGDTVEIVDEVANAYKIKPPAGAFVYLPPGAVRPADRVAPKPEQPDAPKPAPVTPPAPEAEEPPIVVEPPVSPAPQPQPEPVVVAPPAPPAPEPAVTEVEFDAPPAETPAAPAVTAQALLNDPTVEIPLPDVQAKTEASNEMLRAVEIAMLPYLSLPVEQQPIAKMVRGYADAAQIAQLSDSDLAIVQARLTQIERNRELAVALAEANADTTEIDGSTATSLPPEPTAEVVAIDDPLADAPTPGEDTPIVAEVPAAPDVPAAPEPAAPPATPAAPVVTSGYDAIGILTASTVHTGSNQPVLLRLLDPTGRRTVAYLEPDAAIDTVQMIGRVVGIVGESVYDPATKLNLIRPTRVDILSPN